MEQEQDEQKNKSTIEPITSEEIQNIQILRTLIKDFYDPDEHLREDEDVLRFIRACSTLKQSQQMIKDHLEWRQERQPWKMTCDACDEIPGFHALRQIGFDNEGRAVIYTCFNQCQNGIGARNGAEHLIYSIENAILSMKKYETLHGCRGDRKWVWLLDYAGFGYKNMGMSTAKEPLQILQAHYPERLHKVVMLNAPWIFGGFFMMLKPFVDARTYAKACFVRGTDEDIQEGLKDIGIFDEVVPWLLKEMKANRQDPYPEIQREFWKQPTDETVHDPRGPKGWLGDYVLLKNDTNGDGNNCCQRPNGFPSPDILIELTGKNIHEHYEWLDKHDAEWYYHHRCTTDRAPVEIGESDESGGGQNNEQGENSETIKIAAATTTSEVHIECEEKE